MISPIGISILAGAELIETNGTEGSAIYVHATEITAETTFANDVYVSPSQIRRFGLKTGDILEGNTTSDEFFRVLGYAEE